MRERKGRVWAKTMPSHGPWNFISLGVTPYLKSCKTTVTSTFVITSIYTYTMYIVLCTASLSFWRVLQSAWRTLYTSREHEGLQDTKRNGLQAYAFRSESFQQQHNFSFLSPELRIKACYLRPSKYAKTKEELDSKLTCCSELPLPLERRSLIVRLLRASVATSAA